MTAGRDPEAELDQYIDALNDERQPEQASSPDLAALYKTVRSIKAMKEQATPAVGFEEKLLTSLKPAPRRRPNRWWMAAVAAAAAVVAVLVVPGLMHADVAVAMAKAVAKVQSYHGTLEVRVANAAGAEQVVRSQEVWVDGDRYAVKQQDGTTTVNDGNRKWQVRPAEQLVAILPVAPDPMRLGLDLKAEGARAQQYPHRTIGQENVAGRPATVLEVTPPGGDAYRLWVDNETDLPVRLVTAMQNSLQTTYTFLTLNVNQPIDQKLFQLAVPSGYRTEEKDPGQQVATPSEAAARIGFVPVMAAGSQPARMIAYKDRLVMEYAGAVVTEVPAGGTFTPAGYAALGTAAGGPLEVLPGSLRWRQGSVEITVQGDRAEELARSIAPDLKLPAAAPAQSEGPQVKVPVDMEIVRNDQKQVDGGHSPWQLDPQMVVMSFFGARGETGVDYPDLKVTENTGATAVVAVSKGSIQRVYLEKLVRQDPSGIWSVVGYDPR